jgi:hypothetical protein
MTHYSWQQAFDHVKEQGPQRVVQFFKIGLHEMPRLEKELLSSNKETHKKAAEEIRALFDLINSEMNKAMQKTTLSKDEFIKEMKKNKNFTPEEWGQLERVPQLLGQHHSEIFVQRAYKTPKKRSPFFKV